ncbi:MAG: hypothetical protein NXI21_01975 [Alphaproteobacteria bacterium]|nr:hypothetical protein [Alphaproteobacteria bacterium]
MSAFIEPIDAAYFAPNGRCAAGIAWFRSADGFMNAGDDAVLSRLMAESHVSVIRDPEIPPVLYMVGAQSPAAATFGEEWAADATGAAGVPDEEAERLCNAAYYDAAARERPVAHVCRASFRVSPARKVDLFYTRLLLPLRRRGRPPLILCCADLMRHDS